MKDNSTLDTTISDDSQRISEPESATGGSIRPQSPVAPLQAGFSLVGRTTGYVKFFNSQKGYGFIIPAEGELEVFVHHTAILRSDGGFRSLAEGEEVEFDMIKGPKGLQAANVTGPNGTQVIGDPQAFLGQQNQHMIGGMTGMYPQMMGMYARVPPLQLQQQFTPGGEDGDEKDPGSLQYSSPPQYFGGNGYFPAGQWGGFPPAVNYGFFPPSTPIQSASTSGLAGSRNDESPFPAQTTPPKSNERQNSSSATLNMPNSSASLYSETAYNSSPRFAAAVASPYLDNASRRGSASAHPFYHNYYNYAQQYPVPGMAPSYTLDSSGMESASNHPGLSAASAPFTSAVPAPHGGYFYYPSPTQQQSVFAQPLPPKAPPGSKKGKSQPQPAAAS